MKIYVDPSVLAAYYAPDRRSGEAESLLRAFPGPAVSNLGEVELFAAVARKVRRRELDERDADRIRAFFLSHLEEGFYHRVHLDSRHFRLARGWLSEAAAPLRAPDALHLAAAAVERRTLATADLGQAEAARSLGIDLVVVEPRSERLEVHESGAP